MGIVVGVSDGHGIRGRFGGVAGVGTPPFTAVGAETGRGAVMALVEQPNAVRLSGRRVFDNRGLRVGRVAGVVYDRVSRLPRWALVDLGRMPRHQRLAPLRESHRSDGGDLVLAFDRAAIRHAPRVGGWSAMTSGEERALRRHYRLDG